MGYYNLPETVGYQKDTPRQDSLEATMCECNMTQNTKRSLRITFSSILSLQKTIQKHFSTNPKFHRVTRQNITVILLFATSLLIPCSEALPTHSRSNIASAATRNTRSLLATPDQEIIISALSQSSFKRSSSILGINIRDTAALRQLSDDFIKSAVQRRRRPRRCPEYLICLLENPHNSRVACEGVCSNTRNN